MSFSFTGNPKLTLTYSDPELEPDHILLKSAQWSGSATVNVKNENSKKWRIGFVQLLEKNMMQAIYTKHKCSLILINHASMPVLDAHVNPDYRPFYDDYKADWESRPKDVQTSSAQPEVAVPIKMWDEPDISYAWWYNNDGTDPLTEFIMSLQFSTYIVARDITKGGGITDTFDLMILKQWSVLLERRYLFTVNAAVSTSSTLKADLTKTKWEIKNPSLKPSVWEPDQKGFPKNADFIFKGKVANKVFTSDIQTINAKSSGEFVKSRKTLFGN